MPARARHGEAKRWVREAADSKTDECLLWPFSSAGETLRPVIGDNGRQVPVSHLVLRLAGRPLGNDMQANHTCDESFCCNPRHLYAGTQHDNVRDAVRRGRMRGVSDEVIAEIRMLVPTMSYAAVAERLGISFYAARYHGRMSRKAV